MDGHLKLLADASLAVGAAEAALEEGAHEAARERLDEAAAALSELRGRWPGLGVAERRVVGATAGPVRTRLDAAAARIPRRRALAEVPASVDPEQERDPEVA